MEKLKINQFIKSTFILIIGGFITKLLGMVIKIFTTRLVGVEGMGIYSLIMPTFMLFITLSQLGFPIAISTLVAAKKTNNKKLVLGILPISLLINLILLLFLILFGDAISTHLLKETRTYLGIVAIGFVLPFIGISSIIRGYFFGKQRMLPHVISNIMEDVIRLILLIIFIPIFMKKGIEYAIFFLVFSNIFSELSSIIILTICLPKRNFENRDFLPSKKNTKLILQISIPSTSSRIIGNIGAFLEPIIITSVLLKVGYSNSFIINEYGIINGYVLPILMLPSFFTLAISQALIPVISEHYSRNKDYAKRKLWQAIIFSILIGIIFTIFVELYPNFILNFMYKEEIGITYLRVLAPIFLLSYIQTPLTSCMQAMNHATAAMNGTLIGMIIRTVLLFILSYLKIGLWGLVIAMSSNIIYVTIHHILFLRKKFKK